MPAVSVEQRLTEIWETPKGFLGVLTSVDHKTIGIRYLITAIAFLVIGGVEALIMRIQLATADNTWLTPEMYNQIFTLHGTTMILWYGSPILSGFSNYFIPLMIGSRDMAFPRLNAFSYWTLLFSGILLYIAPCIGQAPHAGWFAYAPLTNPMYSPSYGMDFYVAAVTFLTISTTAGAINFIVTILHMRAPGMAISKMPLFMFSTLTISVAIVFSMPFLTVASVMLELERHWAMHFFDPDFGGNPLLWQQLFWFWGHPWVYVVFLPATGMISMLVPVFSRRVIVGYPYIAISTVLTGIVGFSVWLHHMFTAGMSMMAMSFFSAGSMTVSIFSSVQVFAWIATIWRGRLVLTTSMYFALGFLAALVIGGLNGIYTAVIPVDWQVHNTYFVVSHLHYVLIGANVLPVFAAFYYWLPKMTGRMMNETLGKWSFWLMFIGMNVAFFPMHLVGLNGMPRRIYTYPQSLGVQPMNMLMTIGAFILAIGILVSILNLIHSLRHGRVAGRNPWNADGLEWDLDSPPAPYATVHLPTVQTRHPLWDDYEEEFDPENERIFDRGRHTLATTWLDAEPLNVAVMPGESIAPLLISLVLFVVFFAVVFQMTTLLVIGVVCTVIATAFWLWPRSQAVLA